MENKTSNQNAGNLLSVPGAELYYETKGNGPLLLLIPGANGDHFIYTPIRDILAENFTVVTYDRRGFSGSKLNGAQDYENRIDVDADDAASLIKHLSTDPAFVFGSSSGALVSLNLISRHPDLIKKMIVHEPTALKYLKDTEKWKATVDAIYDLYTKEGAGIAKKKFVDELIPGQKDGQLMQQKGDPSSPNEIYWFTYELRQYPSTDFDTEKIEASKDKIIFCVGKDSIETMPAWPVTTLASTFGTDVLYVPGGHLGYLLHPGDFAADLISGIKKRSEQ